MSAVDVGIGRLAGVSVRGVLAPLDYVRWAPHPGECLRRYWREHWVPIASEPDRWPAPACACGGCE